MKVTMKAARTLWTNCRLCRRKPSGSFGGRCFWALVPLVQSPYGRGIIQRSREQISWNWGKHLCKMFTFCMLGTNTMFVWRISQVTFLLIWYFGVFSLKFSYTSSTAQPTTFSVGTNLQLFNFSNQLKKHIHKITDLAMQAISDCIILTDLVFQSQVLFCGKCGSYQHLWTWICNGQSNQRPTRIVKAIQVVNDFQSLRWFNIRHLFVIQQEHSGMTTFVWLDFCNGQSNQRLTRIVLASQDVVVCWWNVSVFCFMRSYRNCTVLWLMRNVVTVVNDKRTFDFGHLQLGFLQLLRLVRAAPAGSNVDGNCSWNFRRNRKSAQAWWSKHVKNKWFRLQRR